MKYPPDIIHHEGLSEIHNQDLSINNTLGIGYERPSRVSIKGSSHAGVVLV